MAISGSPVTRQNFIDATEANMREGFVLGTADVPRYHEAIYRVDNADYRIEREVVFSGFSTYQPKTEGAAIATDSFDQAWRMNYEIATRGLAVKVTWEASQDDPHGIVKAMTRVGGELSQVANYTIERDAMDLFNSYLTTGAAGRTYTADGTSYPVISLTHFRNDGGTWSNRPTSHMDLSIESLEFMISHWMANQVNQRGQKTMTMPEEILVGADDGPLAMRLIKSYGRPQSNVNDPNVVTTWIKNVIVHPLLTNDRRWGALGPKAKRGLRYFYKMKPNVVKWVDRDEKGNAVFAGLYREQHGMTYANELWFSP